MKKVILWSLIGAAALSGTTCCASEREDASGAIEVIKLDENEETESTKEACYLEPETSYQLDLNGDGQTEEFFYKTETVGDLNNGEWQGQLQLFVNDQVLNVFQGKMGTYGFQLYQAEAASGKTYLVADSGSDNDWSSEVWVLEWKDEDSFSILGDLAEKSRIFEMDGQEFLTGWARLIEAVPAEEETEKDVIALSWLDTLKTTGMIEILMEYEITEEGISLREPPYLLDDEKQWTAAVEFAAVKEPGSKEEAFSVKAGEEVSLTALTKIDGIFYIQCEKADGSVGWLMDTEEIVYRENGDHGYFEESMFAG